MDRHATKVLSYLLTHGGNVHDIPTASIASDPSKAVIEILLAHGWDIRARRVEEWPLLWFCVRNRDMLTWCLKHGANVTPKDQKPYTSGGSESVMDYSYHCSPILDLAASSSTVAIFARYAWHILNSDPYEDPFGRLGITLHSCGLSVRWSAGWTKRL